MASIAALAVVASIHDADTLSTVALALAVIAFVAQLIVFVVQADAANAQMVQSRQLHGELQHLLGEMGERTRGTEVTVQTINERLIEAVIGKRLGERAGFPSSADAVRRFAEDVSAEVAADTASPDRGQPHFLPRTPTPDDAEIIRIMTAFPSEDEARAALATLSSLDLIDVGRLGIFAADEIKSRQPWAVYDPGFSAIEDDDLEKAGLVARVPGSEAIVGSPMSALTPEGRELGRLLTATDSPPPALAGEIFELRQRVADLDSNPRSSTSAEED